MQFRLKLFSSLGWSSTVLHQAPSLNMNGNEWRGSIIDQDEPVKNSKNLHDADKYVVNI